MCWRSGPLPIWTTMMKLLPMWWPGSSGPSHMCMPAEPYHSLMPSSMLIAACMRQTHCSSFLSPHCFPGKLLTTQIPDSRHEKNGSTYAHGCSTGMRPACIRTSGWKPRSHRLPYFGGKRQWESRLVLFIMFRLNPVLPVEVPIHLDIIMANTGWDPAGEGEGGAQGAREGGHPHP